MCVGQWTDWCVMQKNGAGIQTYEGVFGPCEKKFNLPLFRRSELVTVLSEISFETLGELMAS